MLAAIDIVLKVGSLAGLAATGFLIYDRWIRDRPICYLCLRDGQVGLRIQSSVNETIIVNRIEMRPADDILGMSRTDDRQSESEAKVDIRYSTNPTRPVFLVIPAGGDRFLPLSPFGRFEHEKNETKIRIRIFWKTTRRFPFIPQWATVKTTVREVRHLREAR
jgi:hypothetical protein